MRSRERGKIHFKISFQLEAISGRVSDPSISDDDVDLAVSVEGVALLADGGVRKGSRKGKEGEDERRKRLGRSSS
jgi:hypothetical protein